MTKERFRELVKKLHPDTSGDKRTVSAFRNVVAAWKRGKSFGKCWCGVTIARGSKHCMAHRIRRPRAAAVIASVLFATVALSAPMSKNRKVNLAWDQYPAPEGITLRIYATNELNSTWKVLKLVNPANTTTSVTVNGYAWWFVMTASNSVSESLPSNVAFLPAKTKESVTLTRIASPRGAELYD